MIRALDPVPFTVDIPELSEEERAANVAANEQFARNVAWWNARVNELTDAHAGKFVVVAGQELFVGDDPAEVTARAKAAHPVPGSGFLCFRISTHRGPAIYAC